MQREAAKWNNCFSSQSSCISRYVLFKNTSCDSKLNSTVEAHDLNKDPKHHTWWPSQPCTLEAGHQNGFHPHLSFRPERGAPHVGAEWLHHGFVFVDRLHLCDWWSQHHLKAITDFGPACGGLQNPFYNGHFPMLVGELAGKSSEELTKAVEAVTAMT